MDAQEKPVTALDLTDLRAADAYLDWPESPDKLRPSRPPKPATPHDYQREAIRDVMKGFKICRPRPAHHGLRHRQDAHLPVHQGEARRRAHPSPGAVAVAVEADDASVAGQPAHRVRHLARLLG